MNISPASKIARREAAACLAERVGLIAVLSRFGELAGPVGAYLVGGAVRDLLRGETPREYDIVTEADLGPILAALGDEGAVDREIYRRFGTAAVVVDGVRVDLARSRAERYPHPGALPEVSPAPIALDLGRRDFTINAIAWRIGGEAADDALLDRFNGLADLEAATLRILHPGSLIDDPTRALRCARYAARLGFSPDPKTLEALRAADLDSVSADRREADLARIAAEPTGPEALGLLVDWGLLAPWPGGVELLRALGSIASEPGWCDLVDRADALLFAITAEPDDSLIAPPNSPSQGCRRVAGLSAPGLILARARGARWLDEWAEQWRHVRSEIGGRDLLAAGIPAGPRVGVGLAAALAARLDGNAADSAAELAAAVAAARGDGDG